MTVRREIAHSHSETGTLSRETLMRTRVVR